MVVVHCSVSTELVAHQQSGRCPVSLLLDIPYYKFSINVGIKSYVMAIMAKKGDLNKLCALSTLSSHA
jgi:hypothetical protein